MAPRDCLVSNFCLQKPAQGPSCVRHHSHTTCKLALAKENYSSITWRKEQMQEGGERIENDSGIELADKIKNGQSIPSAFLQSLQIT